MSVLLNVQDCVVSAPKQRDSYTVLCVALLFCFNGLACIMSVLMYDLKVMSVW